MIRWLTIALAVLLTGCVGFSKTRFSQSQVQGVPQRYEKYVGEMYVLQSVDLHVAPSNSKSKTMMVFPVPLYEGERKSVSPTFSFFVSIISKQPGQELAPQEFAYLSPAGEHFAPTSMVGPYDCRSQQPRPAAVRAPLNSFPLVVGRCYTMLVEFEASAPDPSESFRFSLGSLQSGQGGVALPVVKFSESSRGNTLAVP
ncbi:hypothetical protein [Rubrivivax gelatinosus]|uniref:hypothetical protein n=1 Tax=Rubrivivax gelatinosus TaxID=28068 RepID=UPI00104B0366|nr:hypothetical protein [Rubrivivax gelatinosus]